jgi:hypothetical protein
VPTPSVPSEKPGALRTILRAGLLAGVYDLAFVFVYFRPADPTSVLRGIAAGLLGPEARRGGDATAALGLALHFTIALGAAAVFFALSRKLAVLARRPILSGLLYGVTVWLVMYLVVLPLSANPPKVFPPPTWRPLLFAHLVCVGLPIALTIRRGQAPRV